MPTTSEMLLMWDRRRARSLQKEIGWSEIGVCRKRAGYRLAGTEPTNPSGSVQAVLGTAIDEAVNSVAVDLGLVNQQAVTFAGINGHFDRIEPILDVVGEPTGSFEVVDVKSVGTDRWLEHIELHGAPEHNRWQVNAYAAGLILQGVPVRRVRIDFIARDTGREYAWRQPFSRTAVKDALAWVERVREYRDDLDMLPRDFEPHTMMCRSCPFQRPCWGERADDRDPRAVIFDGTPDRARWAAELFELRDRIAKLREREEHVKGVLDAIRPDDPKALVQAGDRLLEFRPNRKGGYAIYFRAPTAIKRGRRRGQQ
jgi:CRISPR/Cas system-associated exonuclease Cas4 (RecB family)